MMRIEHGDMREVLARFIAEGVAVQSIVTDPPYGLAFMGRMWDAPDNVAFRAGTWRLCFDLLPPGGHLVAFSGTRTYHRMVVAIEEAGFEIRDQLAWLYGSGFPKSHNVSKGIDKRGGASHLTTEIGAAIKAARLSRGISVAAADAKYCGGSTLWTWFEGRPAGQQLPTDSIMAAIISDWPELKTYAAAIAEAERDVIGSVDGSRLAVAPGQDNDRSAKALDLTAPATAAARQWEGWGTALKPALEPICLARKPLESTVAGNVLKHGTGALNIDGCRVAGEPTHGSDRADRANGTIGDFKDAPSRGVSNVVSTSGRWPANVIHDGSDEVVRAFPETGVSSGGGMKRDGRNNNVYGVHSGHAQIADVGHGDSGSAARFFYSAKADAGDRLGSKHPTVKPVDLMRWLVRLITPPGGTVLDPFAGSGTTGMACMAEGFDCILVDSDPESIADIRRRVAHVHGDDTPLFARVAE